MERLSAIKITKEKDSMYESTCLMILYNSPEERIERSVTEKKSKNSKMENLNKKQMTPDKMHLR